jgi:hypothetical protein
VDAPPLDPKATSRLLRKLGIWLLLLVGGLISCTCSNFRSWSAGTRKLTVTVDDAGGAAQRQRGQRRMRWSDDADMGGRR